MIFAIHIANYESASVLPRPIQKFIYGYLCGSDFENYATRILFWQAQKRKPSLYVLHQGKCKKICQIYAPICASNGKTYHNECQLEFARKNDKSLYVKYKGRCSKMRNVLFKPSDIIQIFHYDYYDSSTTED